MVLDFPSNPVNGQTYDNYYWDASTSAWRNNGSKNALSQRLTTLETYPAGLVPIVPSSVAVGSGSASVSGNGLVTFTGVNQLTLNNVFTTAYRKYRVILTPTAVNTASASDWYARFCVSGTGNSTTNYFWGGISANQSTVSATNGYSNTFVSIGAAHPGSTDAWMSTSIIEVYSPMDSNIGTTGTVDAFGWDGPPLRKQNYGYVQNQKIAFDGITFWVNGNPNTSGYIQVYGYRN